MIHLMPGEGIRYFGASSFKPLDMDALVLWESNLTLLNTEAPLQSDHSSSLSIFSP